MLQGLRSFSTTLFLIFCISFVVVGQSVRAEDQVLPWPWETACPFPWFEIEGAWTIDSPLSPEPPEDEFEIRITYVAPDGVRYFNINRYNRDGIKIAQGSGQAADYVKVIRAAMLEYDEDGNNLNRGYWVFLRAHQESELKDCSSDLTTVMTIRPFSSVRSEDVHLVLSKVDGNSTSSDTNLNKKTQSK